MADSLTVPRVVTEGKISQSYKIMLFIGIIVFIVIFLMDYTHNDNNISENNFPYHRNKCIKLDYMNSNNMQIDQKDNIIRAEKIVLYNLNKSRIPINQIVVIDAYNNKVPIQNKNIKIYNIDINESGIEMHFKLHKELMIKKLIIDIDLLNDDISNILTTQVKVFDKNNNITWNNYNPLSIKTRYIELNITKSNIIYPSISNSLTNMIHEESKKEDILNLVLEENTW